MNYSFTITEYDADNIDSSFTVNHGRTQHSIDLTSKTYSTSYIGDNIITQTASKVWEENIPLLLSFLNREIERINLQILVEKTRLYETINFGAYINVGPKEIQAAKDALAETQIISDFLKNYVLT